MKWITADTGNEEYIIEFSLLGFSNHQSPDSSPSSLEEMLENRGALFQDVLFEFIDIRGLKDSDVYKRAGIDRRYFSKIRSNRRYVPKKNTVIALGLALRLDLDELDYLLSSAGYALMPSSRQDVIIRYCVEQGIYRLRDVNDLLYEHTGKTL